MRIITAVGCVALVATTSAPLLAQSRPDFSGTWVVETVELPERPSRVPAGGGPGSGRRGMGGGMRGGQGRPEGGMRGGFNRLQAGQRVTIKQTADRLIVTLPTEAGEQMNTYALDGSESANVAGETTVKSKTKWEGVALVTDSSRTVNSPMGEMTLKTRDVRSLSDDRQTMTVVTTIDTPRGKMTATTTFARAES